ncbi:translation initiation factor IF-2 N-terminal domain-containing protein [Stutzerimonas xanthomarina]
MGTPVTINQILDQETAQLIAEELGHRSSWSATTRLKSSWLSC